MNTDFFNLILPEAGYRCIASRTNNVWNHAFHPENEGAARKAISLDATGHRDVYFACASYDNPSAGRKSHNAQSARSFWLDLDTSEFKIGNSAVYAGKSDALAALARFCCDLGLATATVVASGYGVHAYWSMSDDLAPDQWSETADALRQTCDKWGLKVDHSRTTDIASLLRVPGTHNWKDPENPRMVELLGLGRPISHDYFRAKLFAFLGSTSPSEPSGWEGIESNLSLAQGADHWFDRLSPDDKNACLAEMLQVPAVIALADTSDAEPSQNWRTILAACARSGAPNANNLCRAWAKTSHRFDPENFDVRWRSYARG